jgi:hypothetical protein
MKQVEYKKNYIVYEDGRVWLKRWNRFAKLSNHRLGYLTARIFRKNELMHRIVASCFIPNTENKSSVNHKDGVKTNNHADNLEWVTHAENMQHSVNVLGNNCGKAKTPIMATHILTGKTYQFSSQMQCVKELNLSKWCINKCLNGKGKQHKGYTFEYI